MIKKNSKRGLTARMLILLIFFGSFYKKEHFRTLEKYKIILNNVIVFCFFFTKKKCRFLGSFFGQAKKEQERICFTLIK